MVSRTEERPEAALEFASRAVDGVKIYGSGHTAVTALNHVDVEFASHRFTAIMGPSGSGKSTLLHCLAGLDDLTSGEVFIGETNITALDEKHKTLIRRDKVGFIFPVLQSRTHADGRGEHPVAPRPRSARSGPRLVRQAH